MSGVGLTGEIVPRDGGVFPVFQDINGKGGLRAVADITARDAIPSNSRKIGMVVVTQDDGVKYQLYGGITNSDWRVSSAEVRPLGNVHYVDETFTGAASGAISAPYPTVQAALSASSPGDSILIAPGSYSSGAIAIPHSLEISAIALGSVTLSGLITWTFVNGDTLSVTGVNLPGGIALKDGNSGTGQVVLSLTSLTAGDVINGNPGSAAFTHSVVLSASGSVFGPTSTSSSADMVLSRVTLSGGIYLTNVVLAGNVSCGGLFGSSVFFVAGITVSSTVNSVIRNSEFESSSPVTIALQTGGQLFIDESSYYYFVHGGVLLTGSSVSLVILEAQHSTDLNVNRIDSGNVGGRRLVAIDTTLYVTGDLATVASVGSIFSLVVAAPAALIALVDGITVVRSLVITTSVWVRLKGPPNPSFAATPPLFIDPTLGSDDNDGLASGSNALRTMDEWSRRMDGQILRSPFTVTCAAGDIGNFGPCRLGEDNQTTNVFVTIQGASTLSSQVGTITSVTAEDPQTAQEFIFLDSSGVGPVIPDNSRLQIVSSATSANIGGTGYVKGFGAGGATNPYTSQWTTTAGVGFYPAPGDTYVVSTPTTILRSVQSEWLNSFSAAPSVGGIGWANLFLQSERFSEYQITSNELIGNGNFSNYFIQCIFNDAFQIGFTGCNFRTYGCEFKANVGAYESLLSFHSPMFRAGLALARNGTANLDAGRACFDGAQSGINLAVGGYLANSTDICFSRLSGLAGNFQAVLLQLGGILQVTGQLWSPPSGARNTLQYGTVVFAAGQLSTNFFRLVNKIAASIFSVSSEYTSEITQFTAIENNLSAVTETSLGNGAIALQKSLVTGAGGAVPDVSPTLGTERYTITAGQFGRSSGGALSTVVADSYLTTPTHAQLDSWKIASPTVQSVGTTPAIIFQASTATPRICGPIDNTVLYVEAVFVGYDAADGNVVTTKVSRTFKKIAGTLTAVGTQRVLSPVDGDAALTGSTVTLGVTGVSIQAIATGVAGVTIDWNVYLETWSGEFVG